MEQKIKDFIGVKAIYDKEGQYIWGVDKNGGMQKLADVRGWGKIQNLFPMTKEGLEEAVKFQDELGEWMVTAINSKLNK